MDRRQETKRGKEEEKHFVSPSPQCLGAEGWLVEMLVASGLCHHLGLSGTSVMEKGLGESQGWEEEDDGAFTGCWVLSSRVSPVRGEPWAEGLLRVSFFIPVTPLPHI